MNINSVYSLNGKIALYKYRLVVRHYSNLEKTKYADAEYFCTDEGAEELKLTISKHQLLSLVTEEEIDTSDYAWLEGITLTQENIAKEIADIYNYGSLEAYEASLPAATDEYLLALETEIALMRLGISGGDIE